MGALRELGAIRRTVAHRLYGLDQHLDEKASEDACAIELVLSLLI
jgi:hypothetical protein